MMNFSEGVFPDSANSLAPKIVNSNYFSVIKAQEQELEIDFPISHKAKRINYFDNSTLDTFYIRSDDSRLPMILQTFNQQKIFLYFIVENKNSISNIVIVCQNGVLVIMLVNANLDKTVISFFANLNPASTFFVNEKVPKIIESVVGINLAAFKLEIDQFIKNEVNQFLKLLKLRPNYNHITQINEKLNQNSPIGVFLHYVIETVVFQYIMEKKTNPNPFYPNFNKMKFQQINSNSFNDTQKYQNINIPSQNSNKINPNNFVNANNYNSYYNSDAQRSQDGFNHQQKHQQQPQINQFYNHNNSYNSNNNVMSQFIQQNTIPHNTNNGSKNVNNGISSYSQPPIPNIYPYQQSGMNPQPYLQQQNQQHPKNVQQINPHQIQQPYQQNQFNNNQFQQQSMFIQQPQIHQPYHNQFPINSPNTQTNQPTIQHPINQQMNQPINHAQNMMQYPNQANTFNSLPNMNNNILNSAGEFQPRMNLIAPPADPQMSPQFQGLQQNQIKVQTFQRLKICSADTLFIEPQVTIKEEFVNVDDMEDDDEEEYYRFLNSSIEQKHEFVPTISPKAVVLPEKAETSKAIDDEFWSKLNQLNLSMMSNELADFTPNDYMCNICIEKFNSVTELLNHFWLHHLELIEDVEEFVF
ncbi:hypothetical protein TRFO_15894 [Tritrichomonas foetus]|uniref:C2H2-type domain-containing protein n=1 Tax=Tritrichomonas foetus TaxID=1144522 RepID=A0A1J4KSL0_9EUKA|nr:hypothetical protein TRFO_15894 [Tritrichomonas foetus]|eukprot:OHT13872.1 hypothetical protein TRFO_15894 [Tritrichomonas foetus]